MKIKRLEPDEKDFYDGLQRSGFRWYSSLNLFLQHNWSFLKYTYRINKVR